MDRRKYSSCVILWALLAVFCGTAKSGPTKRLSRMVREVYPEVDSENEGNQAQVCIVGDVVYGTEEPVPAEQPCLKCKCQPPGVQCETIQCAKRPGCKAIHKPNKCCPDYQCECEHHGKFYANGEKLETPPGGECKVCYCRGGEVQCAEVSCYIRKDCEGKRVPGTCCPKYDHCPPIDPIPERSPYTTEIVLPNINKNPYELWPMTGLPPNATEIIFERTSDDIQENKIPDTSYYDPTTSNYKALEVEDLQREAHAKITIQEIIPEIKEIPVTASPRVSTDFQGTLIIEEDFINNSNDLVVTDAEAESSEVSEIFQQPPPILRIGDKLLFLKKGELVPEINASTPSSVITIIGAEGLQRGFEESSEFHEGKEENQTEPAQTSIEDKKALELADSEDLNVLLLNTAASTHILSLVKRKNQVTTTESPSSTESTTDLLETSSDYSSTSSNPKEEVSSTTEPDQTLSEEPKQQVENITAAAAKPEQTEIPKEHEIVTEINPAYPPLPEILSPNMEDTSQRFEVDENKTLDNNGTASKIFPGVLDIRSNKTVPSNITHSEWLKTNTDTLVNLRAVLPEELLMQPAPTDIEDTESTTSGSSASVESLEETSEESKELTTPKAKHSSILNSEDASVEGSKDRTEANDMVEEKELPEDRNIETTTPHTKVAIDNVDESTKNQTSFKDTDVEIIDTTNLQKPSIEKISSLDVSVVSGPGTPLKIIKRENSGEDRSEEEEETDESQSEDEAIFKDLLEDISTPRASRPLPMMSSDPKQKYGNALAQFSLKDGFSDPSVIGLLARYISENKDIME
ncbi:unnamed protein product [Phaedon cochleariae]|uniref:VWFC domain-containing protein n=1 Tax=Phaedon cochleariae TaxID=80249 RepID=A0A9P0DGY3_PHACE|nr:unnamed protein product [Phaedon cochleariae]